MIELTKIFRDIEKIIKEDAGNRNILPFAKQNVLQDAAKSLLTAKEVVIVSGFYIETMKTGETDGPLGAAFLGKALENLGCKVTFMTSPFNEKILKAAINALQLNGELLTVKAGDEINIFPAILSNQALTHLIAIEQMGMALDGNYYNMAGQKISYPIARFDALFLQGREKGIKTIGIGDGGNELGMGNLFAQLVSNIEKKWIANITPVDFLITAGVSNWGAYGLNAALSLLTGQLVLHHPNDENLLLKVILKAGAVDGKTKKREMSVDGLPLKKHIEIVEKLHKVIKSQNYNDATNAKDSAI